MNNTNNESENVIKLFEKSTLYLRDGDEDGARKIFQLLIHKYNQELNSTQKEHITKEVLRLGCGPIEICRVPYNSKTTKLRYEFANYELIEHNYSQVAQDLFVLIINDGKKNGTYLEIGSGDPFHLSNTALLELKFGWFGKGIEWNQDLANRHKTNRKNEVMCVNALTVDYEKLLSSISNDGIVDYLQLDCEPSNVTYEVMKMINFNKFKFRVITYEHDHYVDVSQLYRNKSRKFLQENGYLLAVNDVSPTNWCNFEDWWIHPDLIDKETMEKIIDNDLGTIKEISKYMFK